MGSFSWLRAEHTTKRSNLTDGDKYKILVPKEFGGGYIVDVYYDYGYIFYDNEGEYIDGKGQHYLAKEFTKGNEACDLYGVLAWWNDCKAIDEETKLEKDLDYVGSEKPTDMCSILKNGLTALQSNRCAGISVGCYDEQIDNLKYPLKLVSMSYKGTYEDCKGKSYGDNNQGFFEGYWDDADYANDLEKLISLENS